MFIAVLCAVGAIILSWFNSVILTFILGIPVSVLTKFRFDLFLRIKGVGPQADIMLGFVSILLAPVSFFMIRHVYNWHKKEKSLIARAIWLGAFAVYLFIPAIYFANNVSILDNKNPKNVCVWDEQGKINRVVPRESVINDPRYVWDSKERTYRFIPKSK